MSLSADYPLGCDYADTQLEVFVRRYNELCEKRARNPYRPGYCLHPESVLVDDGVRGTAVDQARRMLSYVGGDRRSRSRQKAMERLRKEIAV